MPIFGRKKLSLQNIKDAVSSEDNLRRAIYVAMAASAIDGTISKAEIESGHTLIMRTFGDKFDTRLVERRFNEAKDMFEEGPISSRREVMRACREIESPEEGEALFSLACDVCGKDGGLGPEEEKWLRDWLAPKLGVKAEDFLG